MTKSKKQAAVTHGGSGKETEQAVEPMNKKWLVQLLTSEKKNLFDVSSHITLDLYESLGIIPLELIREYVRAVQNGRGVSDIEIRVIIQNIMQNMGRFLEVNVNEVIDPNVWL